jgi:endoglucanase
MRRRLSFPAFYLFTIWFWLLIQGCESRVPDTGGFVLNERDYFQNRGVGVMVYADNYIDTHQGGVIVISHGNRIATNGDLRLEATPGQWSPMAKLEKREVDRANQAIRATLSYPDRSKHHAGFNPLHYPDLELGYDLVVAAKGDAIEIRVDLHRPLPREWADIANFQIELYPPDLFGRTWHLDDTHGIFPRQPYGVRAAPGSTPEPKLIPDG